MTFFLLLLPLRNGWNLAAAASRSWEMHIKQSASLHAPVPRRRWSP
jgi:hypothetical protein